MTIVPYSPGLAHYFKTINEEWITEMFQLESKDRKVLENPEDKIIKPGGYILFAQDPELGIIGTVALLKTGEDEYELTKMGVLKKARGKKAGEFLLKAAIQKACSIGAQKLYLLTNKKCESAIHLYEKLGFHHDQEIMRTFGGEYTRCDVAMMYQSQKGS